MCAWALLVLVLSFFCFSLSFTSSLPHSTCTLPGTPSTMSTKPRDKTAAPSHNEEYCPMAIYHPLTSTAALTSRKFIAWSMGTNLWTKLWRVIELYRLPAMWSSWSFSRDDSGLCLVDSGASTLHACFVFGILLDSPRFASVSWNGKCFFVPFLHGIAASIGTSNFFLFFLWFLFLLHLLDQCNKCLSIFRALSSFGFSIARCCFSLSFERLFQLGSILHAAHSQV